MIMFMTYEMGALDERERVVAHLRWAGAAAKEAGQTEAARALYNQADVIERDDHDPLPPTPCPDVLIGK